MDSGPTTAHTGLMASAKHTVEMREKPTKKENWEARRKTG